MRNHLVFASLSLLAWSTHAGPVDLARGTLELSPLPLDLTQSVSPNVVVTFDDSGSMAFNYMGDAPPFRTGPRLWSGPWHCAAVIDPSGSDPLRMTVMNGVYYNPNITYEPPLRADGTAFPQAGASANPLAAVWVDGIAVNRRFRPARSQAVGYRHNPHWRQELDGAVSNLIGTEASARWRCGDSLESADANNYTAASPMNGQAHRLSDGSTITYPLGGPYYYRLRKDVSIAANAQGVPLNDAELTKLYTVGNWEAIPVPASQHQNFANWYAYYRTRSQAARSATSRVFGALGEPQPDGSFGSLVRVTWQHLNASNYLLPQASIITELLDQRDCQNGGNADPAGTQTASPAAAPSCYRSAFFNWLFTAPVNGGTPVRTATIRAGEFFRRADTNLRSPYWHVPAKGANGSELSCRQNFHMLVTDGMWNSDTPARGGRVLPDSGLRLPDGVAFPHPVSSPATRIYAGTSAAGGQASLSDLAFHYWASNLRPDLYDPAKNRIVAPYLPDRSIGITPVGQRSGSRVAATDVDQEIYFNPANDPATWPHMSQYLVGLGVRGRLQASRDTACLDPQSDACRLRKGERHSGGFSGWPVPDGNNNGIVENIDDTWHAAVAARGQYFSAGDPQSLIDQLGEILSHIVQRNVPAALSRTDSSVLVPGVLGFLTSFDPGDWHGNLEAATLDAQGAIEGTAWSAGSLLDRSQHAERQILTSRRQADGRFDRGVAFREFNALDPDAQRWLADTPAPSQAGDTGQARLDWLRGQRDHENDQLLRSRSSLFGAVVNAQATYVAYPTSGYTDTWPKGSPEARAAEAGHSYERFVADHIKRRPMVYLAANDGMLHAFDASQERHPGPPPRTEPGADAGRELFAYVPRTVFPQLGNLSSRTAFQYMPTVDATPVTREVFFSEGPNAGWRSLLVGGLRLGGRGVYALDITDPDTMTEAHAEEKVLWEFHAGVPRGARSGDGDPANLGYSFGQPNIGRLANGSWAVLVPGGYFPDCAASSRPAPCQGDDEAAARPYSSLFVLDAQSGALIREIRTPGTGDVTSHGLSSPVLGDYEHDQIDDVAFAGDLVGNLWRFDLTSPDPANWSARLLYQPDHPGEQPITVMPRLFPDIGSDRFMVIFGTGQYLGPSDNTSQIPVQSIMGVRERDDLAAQRGDLVAQKLAEALADDGINTVRGLTRHPLPADARGWLVDLDVVPGERVVVTPTALFDTNQVVIITLIPGNHDPCDTDTDGAFMVIDAATGGSGDGISQPHRDDWTGDDPLRGVGGRVRNPPTSGSLPPLSQMGGGAYVLPGLMTVDGKPSKFDAPLWRRRSWSRLQ